MTYEDDDGSQTVVLSVAAFVLIRLIRSAIESPETVSEPSGLAVAVLSTVASYIAVFKSELVGDIV